MPLELSAPQHITFFVAVAIAVIAAILHYAYLGAPYVGSQSY
jgi:hypothetical protein